ncbi:MAG: T9SS C-terminal target domain-containing protein [Ignavibacteriae bacterium]|nr:MAG: T9SS C-terminal target domain-containing protein [Ignavibacteriota bacterium]
MNDQRLDRALHHLKGATVTPALVSDADILSRDRHPHVYWWLLVLLVSMLGTWWIMSSDIVTPTPSLQVSTAEAPAPTTKTIFADTTPTITPTDHSTLDPRSILVLSLTDEELGAQAMVFYRPSSIPTTPSSIGVDQQTQTRQVTLGRTEGIVGQPWVELDSLELLAVGIVRDSVSIIQGVFSNTLELSRCTFIPSDHVDIPRDQTVFLHFSSKTVKRVVNKDSSFIQLPNHGPFAEGSFYEVHIRGTRNSIVKGSRRAWSGSIPESFDSLDWIRRYPKAADYVRRTAKELLDLRIPVDSLASYFVPHLKLPIPVSRLLIGVRISTEWSTSPDWSGEERRLVHFNWYLPSQQTLDALPEHIRSFVQPEFEALYASIEKELTAKELCDMLDRPSAFGLCSIADSTFRIDGIGPIPARESFTVFVHSSSPTIAALQLVGDDARVLLELNNIQISQGANQISIPIANENIPSGAYTVVLTTREGTRTSRVLIQR